MSSMEKYISSVVKSVPPSGIRKFFDLASQMQGVISLGVGEPDSSPLAYTRSLFSCSGEGYTMYTSNHGLIELREEIALYQKHKRGVCYSPEDEILVTIGVSEAIDLALRALVEPGDEVLVPDPSFVCYAPGAVLAYGKAVPVKTFNRDQYRLKPEELEKCITPRSKILILSYPSNPTGAIMHKKT